MYRPQQDPDASLVALFKYLAIPNLTKTAEAGRLICDDVEAVEIRSPGSRNFGVYPATSVSHWLDDPQTGEQTKITYAERFARQYQQFKAQAIQTKSGTPLAHASFMSEGRRAEMRAQNIYTVEALAAIDGQELKNLGPGGRELKNAAMAYIEESRLGAVDKQMQAELETLKARNALLEEDVERLKIAKAAPPEDEFEGMSLEQLRDFITTNTGQAPHGALNRKTLARMAREAASDKVA
jgi:hypothetical protein